MFSVSDDSCLKCMVNNKTAAVTTLNTEKKC